MDDIRNKEDRMPHNLDAEIAVVGYLLYYNDKFDEVFAEISADMFYDERLKVVFSSIFDLRNEGIYIDKITVKNKSIENINAYKENVQNIKKNAKEKSGYTEISLNDDFFSKLIDGAAVEGSLMPLCGIIKNKYILRRAIAYSNNIINRCRLEDNDAIDICNDAQLDFFKLGNNNAVKSYKRVGEFIKPIFDDIEKAVNSKDGITGVATNFRSLDTYTGGFQPSDMIVLAGRPGMGKTTFALNLAYNMAENMKNVLFFSLEMNGKQLVKRILSALSFVPSDKMRTGKVTIDDMRDIVIKSEEMSKKNLFIYENTLLTIADLRNECMKIKVKEGLDIVFIDYLQLMVAGENYKGSRNSSFMPRQEEVAAISRNIKALAKELDVPIIALSQLNRDAETKDRPQLSDLRESGAIEQDADMVLLINKPKDKENENEDSNRTDIIIAKHRNGSTGTINLRFDKATTSFNEWDRNV